MAAKKPPRAIREVAKDIYALVGKRKAKRLEKLLKELAAALSNARCDVEEQDQD